MLIDKTLLDELTGKAKVNPRLRMNYDLRDSSEDESQRMLNAIEPGTVIPIHRHSMTSEDVAILRGKAEFLLFDDEGHEVSRCLLFSGGDVPAVHVPMGQYHACKSLESGTVIMEVKNTMYDPQGTELLKCDLK